MSASKDGILTSSDHRRISEPGDAKHYVVNQYPLKSPQEGSIHGIQKGNASGVRVAEFVA